MYFKITQIQICYFIFYVELYFTPQVRFYLLGSYLLLKTALHEFACKVPVCFEISKENNLTLDDPSVTG